MAKSLQRAVVIGAGLGGLTAARALADRFDEVVVLERDVLAEAPGARAGTPQGNHVHVLLAGGLQALEALFPGFENDLVEAGAVPYISGLELRFERPGFDPFPQRDLGLTGYSMTRWLLEWLVRRRVRQQADITLREGCRVMEIVAGADGAVTGVRFEPAGGGDATTLQADFVVDASGRGSFCLGLLEATGCGTPAETEIGVDVGYSTAIFTIPDDAPPDWKAVLHLPHAPHSSRGAFLFPIEGGRWMVALGGRGEEKPPGDREGFIAFTRQLRTPTLHDALRNARFDREVMRFAFPASLRRHYAALANFPRGLLPVADAICRFNPLYGQGMTVAACEARMLRDLLAAPAKAGTDPLQGLAPAFFAAADELIDAAWTMSVLPDLVYPQTVGERPPDLEATLRYSGALSRVAAVDPAVHKLMTMVQHLLEPRSALREPALAARVMAEMTPR